MSCTERFSRLTAHQNRPIGKTTQNAARSSAGIQRIRRPLRPTTRTPMRPAPMVRPLVAKEIQR